jgi:subtilase family serine protease
VDADDQVDELTESNNTRSSPVQIGADLVVSALTSVSGVGAGETVVLSDTVTNVGSAQAGASVVRFFLSSNFSLDAGDTQLDGSRNVGALAAGQTSSGSTTVTLPASLATGPYYIIAMADADEQVAETRETNNTRGRIVSVGPDLRGSVFASPSSVARGATLVATDTVSNTGGGAAGASTTRFYLSANFYFDVGDISLGVSRTVPGIAAGSSNSGSTTISIPATVSAGTYYLLAIVDADTQVDEVYETNNVAIRRLTVTN